MGKKSLLTLITIITITFSLLYLLHAGDPAERKQNVHSGNKIRTTFFNYGLTGRENAAEDFGMEWPVNSGHFYAGDLSFLIGAEVTLPNGQVFHSVEVADGPRGNNEENPNNPADFWGWEPLPGFANPGDDLVAMSHQPNSWPGGWNGWLGIPNNAGVANQEGFFTVDDGTDREFFFNYGFLPDSADPGRYGMGWQVKVRSFQFSEPLYENALVYRYDIKNEGTTFYPNAFFSMLIGATMGGDGDTNDDMAGYDLDHNLVYAWDLDNIGSSGWSPVGYLGLTLLETPGLDFDGIDNDGDGATGSGSVIDASVLSPFVIQVGDPVVLIDYDAYTRTVTTFPGAGVVIHFNGQTYQILPGDTLRETPNGIDDNLNGLIDEITEIPGNGLDDNGNDLVDEDNPHWGKKYINYFTGNGVNNPLIEESKFDGIDNDGDWNLLTDDLGLDGLANTGDPGEGDGIPTSGAGTGFPGEPHIDLTDPDEADQTGLTSFLYFAPFNFIKLNDDENLWKVSEPGYFLNAFPNSADGDIILGSGYFPSLPGDSQRVAIALVMGVDLANLRANVNLIQELYNENFAIREFPFQANFPTPGSAVSGNYPLDINVDNGNPGVLIDLYSSNNFGDGYQLIEENLTNPIIYNWQTSNHPDGIFYKLKVLAKADSFLTAFISDSVFTINNPGNGAPEIRFVDPIPSGNVRDTVAVYWLGGDPEGLQVEVTLSISLDSGNNWQVLSSNLPAAGSYPIDTRLYPNALEVLLKLEITDGEFTNEVVLPSPLFINNSLSLLPDSLLVHHNGNSDASVTVIINDSLSITNHLYRLSYTVIDPQTKFYHVFDRTDSLFKIHNQPLLSAPGPVFDGMYLQINDIGQIDVLQNLSGWSNPQINTPYNAMRFSMGLAQGIAYPADYQLIFSDHVVDTSWAGQFPFLPPALPLPVNYTIQNVSENRPVEFALWPTPQRDVIAILEPDSLGQLQLTWEIEFFYNDTNLVLPSLGDTFHLEIAEPLTGEDVYFFSSEIFVVGTGPKVHPIPNNFSLGQNYPNPFNPATTIRFTVPQPVRVKLEIFDILGRRISTLIDEQMTPGEHRIEWNGRNGQGGLTASGIYFYRLTAGKFVKTRKMALLR